MPDVTTILSKIESGDARAAELLLPIVYEDLRRLASARLRQEKPGQTLQATALVHEAFLRLTGGNKDQFWDSRGHFFAAAAEAMRRILVENARRKGRQKHGGERQRVELHDDDVAADVSDDRLLAVNEALDRLALEDPSVAELVKLRFFAGLSLTEAAEVLG
ncbi:MAG: RNA polymerase subunit sigma, partial [Planctomycetales bacterium]|nr:RNA polymerase subunit sigma [Planctomycetales bacterium]